MSILDRFAVPGTAAIVTGEGEAVMAEMVHEGDLVAGHFAEAIGGDFGRFAAVAVAAQVGADDAVDLRQFGGDTGPERAGLREAVEEKERRAVAGFGPGDLRAVEGGGAVGEAGDGHGVLPLLLVKPQALFLR